MPQRPQLISLFVGASVAFVHAAFGDATTVSDTFRPADSGTVRIAGHLGEKIDLCIQNEILAQHVDTFVTPFRDKKETGERDWRCEYWGKWFTALALADAYESTPKTASLRDAGTRELLTTAAEDGYIGTRQPNVRMQGWDTWGCKYTLLGVLASYDRTHDPVTLNAARRQGDVLCEQFGPGGTTNIEDVGEWNGLPASSVLEPVVQLYERTGDQKYLDLANNIVASWDKPSKRLKNGMRLIQDAIAGTPPSKMCAPKAYEMMSCFEGLCELYRITGEPKYLAAPVALAESIRKHELNITGCGTSNEVWFDGINKQTAAIPKPMETCVTATWMKLNYQLLRLTGNSEYADELERNLYNSLLGAMMPDGNWWAYFSGTMGVRVPSYVQHDDVGTSCCVLNGPRGLMITPSWAFMNGPDGPVVNLFNAGSFESKTAGGQSIKLEVSGNYPVDGPVTVSVKLDHPETFSIYSRIPSWSEQTSLKLNGGTVFSAKSGSYSRIRRSWTTGDQIQIQFDLRGHVVPAPGDSGQVAIIRGPIVLSMDSRLMAPMVGSAIIRGDNAHRIALKPNPEAAAKIKAWMAFDIDAVVDEKSTPLTVCDYADAGSAFSKENFYRTWLPQPLDLKEMYNTGQTWKTLTHSNHWTDAPKN